MKTRITELVLTCAMQALLLSIHVAINGAIIVIDAYEFLREKAVGPRPTVKNGGIK